MTRSSGGETRANLFLILLFLLSGLVVYRLFNLTVIRHSAFVKTAESQYNNPSALLAGRGSIYFSDFAAGENKLAATNKLSSYLYSDNTEINSTKEVVEKISSILDHRSTEGSGNAEELELLLSQKGKTYVVIARNLTKKQAEQINALKINGLTVATEVNRYYAQDFSAAHVLGFVGFSGNQRAGQYGIEFSYDDVLSGESKTQELFGNKTYSDILKFLKFWNYRNTEMSGNTENDGSGEDDKATGGSDIVLTIDRNIQSMVDLTLNVVLRKWSAPRGSIIIEDPNTGAILAMSSSPSFDPNNYSAYKLNDFINPSTQEVF